MYHSWISSILMRLVSRESRAEILVPKQHQDAQHGQGQKASGEQFVLERRRGIQRQVFLHRFRHQVAMDLFNPDVRRVGVRIQKLGFASVMMGHDDLRDLDEPRRPHRCFLVHALE